MVPGTNMIRVEPQKIIESRYRRGKVAPGDHDQGQIEQGVDGLGVLGANLLERL